MERTLEKIEKKTKNETHSIENEIKSTMLWQNIKQISKVE